MKAYIADMQASMSTSHKGLLLHLPAIKGYSSLGVNNKQFFTPVQAGHRGPSDVNIIPTPKPTSSQAILATSSLNFLSCLH